MEKCMPGTRCGRLYHKWICSLQVYYSTVEQAVVLSTDPVIRGEQQRGRSVKTRGSNPLSFINETLMDAMLLLSFFFLSTHHLWYFLLHKSNIACVISNNRMRASVGLSAYMEMYMNTTVQAGAGGVPTNTDLFNLILHFVKHTSRPHSSISKLNI